MNKLLAGLLDTCGLIDLHKNKSKVSHFSKSFKPPILLDDMELFYPVPSTPDICFEQNDSNGSYNLGKYKFKSEIEGNGDSNSYSCGTFICGIYKRFVVLGH